MINEMQVLAIWVQCFLRAAHIVLRLSENRKMLTYTFLDCQKMKYFICTLNAFILFTLKNYFTNLKAFAFFLPSFWQYPPRFSRK